MSAIYWIKYARAGKSYDESSRSTRKGDARTLLRDREGDIVKGKPVTPKTGRTTFEDAAADLLADYTTNGKRSYGVVERRIRKHLAPFFGGRRLTDITTSDVRAYIQKRQTTPSVVVVKGKHVLAQKKRNGTVVPAHDVDELLRTPKPAEINRELALLKRMFTLAIQAAKVLYRPHIPMLKENNVRTGFFEPEQFASVLAHLPAEVQPVIEFANITGWRIRSEVLPLKWRQIDFAAAEIRLDAGTTKNGDGRVFPMTAELKRILLARHAEHERLKKAGVIVPWVFFREVAEGRGGDKKPQPIVSFTKAWKSACAAAACPGRIPHDLRRTAIRGLVRAGIPERVAMQMTGHKTPSVFQRYNIVSGADLKAAARRLDEVTPVRQGAR
ncbi:MAG: site-specific integrase [Acidobacteria bacterium]|nr:site-specific integrase [Acidobacteriota bacterium]